MKSDKILQLFSLVGIVGILVCLTACESYLEKAPESNITDKEIFGNFDSFQGWVERTYSMQTNVGLHWAGDANGHTFDVTDIASNKTIRWDDGDYWNPDGWVMPGSIDWPNWTYEDEGKVVWAHSWYAIRQCNVGLSMLHLLEGTQEERELIKGQTLFFRAFFHCQLMSYWGGMPYVEEPLDVSQPMELHRLTYRECALLAARDFQDAADLLPLTWRNTNTKVKDNNYGRITKLHALGYKGKCLLYAASPMMNEASGGINDYDVELCREAAKTLAEAIALCESGKTDFQLEPWENWTKIFWTISPNTTVRPGAREVIHNSMIYNNRFTRWNYTRCASPQQWEPNSISNSTQAPTHEFTELYGMANGLPIDDPDSGYDPNHPWTNREPRFYNDIIVDGDRMITNANTPPEHPTWEFAELHNTGWLRFGSEASEKKHCSVTGYLFKKYLPNGFYNIGGDIQEIRVNPYDMGTDRLGATTLQANVPCLRVSDLYMMYAEAAFFSYGRTKDAKSENGHYTGQQAMETIRHRAQLPPLPDEYYADKGFASNNNSGLKSFRETLMRERAVEFAFEGLRWFDLRRWNVGTEVRFREKSALNFDRNNNGDPINIEKKLILTRVFDKRNNWMPIMRHFTQIHEGFDQNPGWN